MSYQINQNFISKNRSGKTLSPIGMVVHDTATKGATDENEQAYFNNNNVQASAHTFIDWNSITETVPDNEVAWGSGPTSNHEFLQVELCVPASHDPCKFQEVWDRATWYFAYKFINKINIKTVTKDNLISHAEVSNRWGETDHQDPIAYFQEYGKTVDDFRQAVQIMINTCSGGSFSNTNTSGGTVKDLQHNLNRLFNAGLAEDNDNGPMTTAAINKFGPILGSTEISTLIALTNQILSFPLIQQNSSGAAVRYVQYRVGANIDGSFGPNTKSKVMAYQSGTKDGIVGPVTWSQFMQ